MVKATSIWARDALAALVTILLAAILLWVGSCPALFQIAWERITAKIPLTTNGDLGKEQGAPRFTVMMQDRYILGEAS